MRGRQYIFNHHDLVNSQFCCVVAFNINVLPESKLHYSPPKTEC